MKQAFSGGLVVLFCAACGGPEPGKPEGLAVEPAVFGDWGVDLPATETGLQPGDDFHAYVNGVWLAANPVPPERSSWGSSSA